MNYDALQEAMKLKSPEIFENIFSKIQNKLNEFEEAKKTFSYENDSPQLLTIQKAKESIDEAFKTSDMISQQREKETAMIDQWLEIINIQQKTFKETEISDDYFPDFAQTINDQVESLDNLQTNLLMTLRTLLSKNELPETTRLKQLQKRYSDAYKSRKGMLNSILLNEERYQNKFNSLTKENIDLKTKLIETEEYARTFMNSDSFDAIFKAKKIKLARDLANEKKIKINEEMKEIEKDLSFFQDPDRISIVKQKTFNNDKVFVKKQTDYKEEIMKLSQEISMVETNAESMFKNLENELKNARSSELAYEKNQTQQILKVCSISFDRILNKFKKEEKDSIMALEKVLKEKSSDPVLSLTTDNNSSVSRRKHVLDPLIKDLQDILQKLYSISSKATKAKIKEIKINGKNKISLLKSYLSRMKAKLAERDLEISSTESLLYTEEGLLYDIMETLIDMKNGPESKKYAQKMRQLRLFAENANHFISKTNYMVTEFSKLLNDKMEKAKENFAIDGIYDNRPFSQKSSFSFFQNQYVSLNYPNEKQDLISLKYDNISQYTRDKIEYMSRIDRYLKINQRKKISAYRHTNFFKTYLQKTSKVRIPILWHRPKVYTDEDLLPDKIDENLFSHSNDICQETNDFIQKQRLRRLGLYNLDSSEEWEEKIRLLGGRKRPKSQKALISKKINKKLKRCYSNEPIDDSLNALISNSCKGNEKCVLASFNGKIGFLKDGKFIEIDPSNYHNQNGYFKDGKFISVENENDIFNNVEDGTVVIINGKAGIIKDGKFIPLENESGEPGEKIFVNDKFIPKVSDKSGYYVDGHFIHLNSNEDTFVIDENGNIISVKNGEKLVLPDGTVAEINGKKGVIINGKFVPVDEAKLNIPKNAELAIVDGKLGYIKDGEFIPLNSDAILSALATNSSVDQEAKDGVFINGKFIPLAEIDNLPEELKNQIKNGTIGIIDGKPVVFKDGKFVPLNDDNINNDGILVDFDNIPDEMKNQIKDGTIGILNGKPVIFQDGKFIPIDKNMVFKDGKFVELDSNTSLADIPDGTVAIINGVKGIIQNGKFVPDGNAESLTNGFQIVNSADDLSKLPDGTNVIFNGQMGIIQNGKFVPLNPNSSNPFENKSGYFKDGKFIPIDLDDIEKGLLNIEDGTRAIINGKSGVFMNNKFIPDDFTDKSHENVVDDNFSNKTGFIIDGKFVEFDPETGDLSKIPNGTVGYFKGKKGIFQDGKFIPLDDSHCHQTGYYKDGKFIPIDSANIHCIPDGSFGCLNGKRGIFKNGKFIPIDDESPSFLRPGYFKNGQFIPIDPNNIPLDKNIVFMMGDGTIITRDVLKKMYPGLYALYKSHHRITPYNTKNPNESKKNWPDNCEVRPPDPLYKIEPIKFPKHPSSFNKPEKRQVELSPEEIRKLMYQSPNIQFDPATTAKINDTGLFSNCNLFCLNFKPSEPLTPRRNYVKGIKNKSSLQVYKSDQSAISRNKYDDNAFSILQSYHNKNIMLNEDDLPNKSCMKHGIINNLNRKDQMTPQRLQHMKAQSAYQKFDYFSTPNNVKFAKNNDEATPQSKHKSLIVDVKEQMKSRIYNLKTSLQSHRAYKSPK